MAVVAQRVSVGTSATLLSVASDADPAAGQSIAVKNLGAAPVFLGGSGVTTAAGWEVAAGAPPVTVDMPDKSALYGIVASGTVSVQVLQVGV